MHELNTQLKMKDLWIEAVIGVIGWDKIPVPEGMVLYSGEDYVHFWEGEDKQQKGDLKENVKEDLNLKEESNG